MKINIQTKITLQITIEFIIVTINM